MKLYRKILLPSLLIIKLLLFSASGGNEYERVLKIYKNEEIIGTVEEKLECRKGFLFFKKNLQYISGEKIETKFKISKDFSYFKGYVRKNNKRKTVISNEDICFKEKRILPSSILQLYIHKLIKEKESLPSKTHTFYEPKGEILNVKIKCKKQNNFFVLNYFFEEIGVNILEIFAPENNMYYQKAGNICLVDERIEKEMLSKIKNNLTVSDNRVNVPEDFVDDFSEFSKVHSILYEIRASSVFFIEEDNRQKIVSPVEKNVVNTIMLKVSERENIGNKIDSLYAKYIQSLDKFYKIDSLTLYITQNERSKNEKVRKVIDWLSQNIASKSNGPVNPILVLENREGDCQGISNLFLLMVSSLNIPARAVVGIVVSKQNNGYFWHFHQWTEVWERGNWKSYDPAFGTCKIRPNYIKLFTMKKGIDILKVVNAVDLKIRIVKQGE